MYYRLRLTDKSGSEIFDRPFDESIQFLDRQKEKVAAMLRTGARLEVLLDAEGTWATVGGLDLDGILFYSIPFPRKTHRLGSLVIGVQVFVESAWEGLPAAYESVALMTADGQLIERANVSSFPVLHRAPLLHRALVSMMRDVISSRGVAHENSQNAHLELPSTPQELIAWFPESGDTHDHLSELNPTESGDGDTIL